VNTNPATYLLLALALAALALARARLERHRRWRRVFDGLVAVEIAALVLLLGSLIFLGGAQIVLRNVAKTGILWADPFMRHVVLWIGCLGATLATARVRHINIDALTRVLSGRWLAARDVVVHAVTAVAAFVLGVAALRLVIDEKSYGDVAFLGIDTWLLQTILPIAFLLISYRSLVNMLLRRRPAQDGTQKTEGA
jgi:TRAP-type C4-dicarboxylate transport system permease small subunit